MCRLTASTEVLVPYRMRVNDVEGPLNALGRNIDVPICTQWSRSYPEHMLFLDHCHSISRYLVVEFAHCDDCKGGVSSQSLLMRHMF